ncbi:hypothetical protein GQR60_17565 [Labilibaculum sp. A4]|uniref:carboxypeptidase-like regulatory domain-containing protein n=1 Tax=Labilibaculum euxinus TaxID=2686357 RepID=UPI000F6194F1|nr:carboxypeptidase-like regulatory domain-containing protein [Labilibaculum euxinus]MDQ1772442.1 carboxypeptidase-like regulatory domain-containing protein [Labilibaculum euxinus]MWN78146.1 hypothetical protein [Labilibaculum euxinus]
MSRIILTSFFQLICCFSVYSQEIRDKVLIKNDTIILNRDTLVIGMTELSDILTKSQIDSLGSPCIVHWDGDCDSGTDYEYWIETNSYEIVCIQDSLNKYILKTISIKNTNNTSLFFEDGLNANKLTKKGILDLGFIKEKRYKQKKNVAVYKKVGIHLTVKENLDSLLIKSIHFHPKSWDKHLKIETLKGEVRNTEGESLPGVLFLAYNQFDSLKYYETTDFDGKYYFEIDSIKKIDVFNFNYEPQIIKVTDNKDQTINFKLKKNTYYLPDLIVAKSGEIRIDSTCYLDQFPKVRDSSKINVWLVCEFSNFNPLISNLPSAIGGLRNSYVTLVSSLNSKRKLRKCEAEVYFVIDKFGQTKLIDIICDDKINKEYLARYMVDTFKWTTARWRGRRIDSNWSLKIIFE